MNWSVEGVHCLVGMSFSFCWHFCGLIEVFHILVLEIKCYMGMVWRSRSQINTKSFSPVLYFKSKLSCAIVVNGVMKILVVF